MVKHRNIYEPSEPEPPKQEKPAFVESTPDEIRARTRRQVTIFSTIMLVLLAAASWLIYLQEQKGELPPAQRSLVDTTSLQPRPMGTATSAAPTLAEPARIQIPEPAETFQAAETNAMNPDKVARAMGEARIGADYLRARDFEKAELHARKALEISPAMNAAQRLLGAIYIQRGQFDQAIAILEDALKTDAFNAETYNNLASAYLQKGMLDKAEELLQTSLQIAPEYRATLLNLGLVSLLRARYDDAASYFERAIEKMPSDPTPRNNYAVALMRLGKFDEARKQLDLLIDLNPGVPDPYFNKAISYVRENKYPEAIVWLKRGTEHCSPVQAQKFLSDNDFNPIRGMPDFQKLVRKLFPELPAPPTS